MELYIRFLFIVGNHRKIGIIQKYKNIDSQIRFCENRYFHVKIGITNFQSGASRAGYFIRNIGLSSDINTKF